MSERRTIGPWTGIQSARPGLPLIPNRYVALVVGSGYVTMDGMAADAYGQADEGHLTIMLVRNSDPSIFHYWAALSHPTSTINYIGAVNQTGAAGAEGRLRGLIANGTGLVNQPGTAATEHIDGEWHLVQSGEWLTAPPVATVWGKVGSNAREAMGTYTRFADPGYGQFSLGVRRHGTQVDLLHGGDIGYLARIDFPAGDTVISDAQQSDIHAAFSTGGGRRDTRVVTASILDIVAPANSGRLKWAGNLDGGPGHWDPDGVGPPVFVGDHALLAANY